MNVLVGFAAFVVVIAAAAYAMDTSATPLPGAGEGSTQPGHEGHDHP